ncbi:hypothetical protein Tco_0856508 [Tanacetum coccineum]|uniref:Uncharacterized protein n=1 Tax=Tanacetum coccineum TaxID=301880 RepID=A0ABQ5B7I6_9ASTR
MDDPNISMEEYIRLDEEKYHRGSKVFNWETAKYGKIWYDEDVHDLKSIKTEFPAIVFDDAFTSKVTHSSEPTVSPLNDNKLDFRISFDESDDQDYTVIYDKNSFSNKIISVNDLKTDSENDNDKVNFPLFPAPEPTVSCFNDLDFFKDFENEFPGIIFNDASTSKSDSLTELILSPQHIDWNDETSLSKYDEKKQNVYCLYGVSIPHGYGILTIWTLSSLYFQHSLEDVFVKRIQRIRYRYQYGVSKGMDTAYRLPVQF